MLEIFQDFCGEEYLYKRGFRDFMKIFYTRIKVKVEF